MNDCIFCKIANGEIPSKKFYEDDKFVIIADIAPQAKLHYLAIPKKHYADIVETAGKDTELLSHILKTVAGLVETLGLQNGFRMITNRGDDGCQSVKHLHIHLLGGEKLAEKMG